MISYNVLQKRLISQEYKKNSHGKYALLLYPAFSIMFDATFLLLLHNLVKIFHACNCLS